jgi:NAD(P)-dependent dehydrogenase (short-subunit alcohol dehydrogenase family)
MRLRNRVSIVTGAGSGIGLGIAEVFSQEGSHVVCVDRREKEGILSAEQIQSLGGSASFVHCDITEPKQFEALVKEVLSQFGHIDVLVNNAGVNFVKNFHETTLEEWDRVIGVDLRGTFLCIRACIDTFLRQGAGSVVNVASVHTQACLPGAAPYDAAKWGMVGLTKSLAVEYASRGIRFNCLSPGLIDTQIWQDIQDGADDLDSCLTHWRSNIPAGRVGTIHEMGKVAAFLASDDSSYITGANLFADGGMTSLLISREPVGRTT